MKSKDHDFPSSQRNVACVASVPVEAEPNRTARKMGREQKGGGSGVGWGKKEAGYISLSA